MLRVAVAVLGLVVLVALATFAISSLATKQYTAQATLVVTAGLGLETSGEVDVLTAPRIATTYATLARTRPVLEQVISRLDLPYGARELDARMRLVTDPGSPFVTISVTEEEPVRAQRIANAVAVILLDRATSTPSADTPGQVVLEIVERASTPDEPSGPRVLFNTVLAAAVTLAFAIAGLAGVAYLRGWEPEPEPEPEPG